MTIFDIASSQYVEYCCSQERLAVTGRQAILQAKVALQYFRHGGVCCAESAVLLLSADFYCREAGSSLQQQSIFGFAVVYIAAVVFHAARVYGEKIGRDVHTHT